MIREVERDDTESLRDVRVVEQVPILTTVRTGGVQAQQRHTLPRFLEEDSIVEVVVAKLQVSADDRFEIHAAPTSRITFITRCSARACCMATSESPSSTKPGTRISIAKTS